MNAEHEKELQAVRHAVRDKKRVGRCLGFGPRFLHSTGQAYKGGPNSGVFLQITCDDAIVLPVPGQKYRLGWSRRRRRAVTSKFWPIVAGVHFVFTWARM